MAAGSKSAAAEERHDEGAVELSLRLRTGGGGGSNAVAEEDAASAAARRRRSMTIFYNGRVCAVDVTEQQAKTIIAMANHQILTEQQQRRRDSGGHLQDSSSSSDNNNDTAGPALDRCAPAPQCSAPSLASSLLPQGLIGAAEGTVVSHAAAAGLSMKRSLQQFLQKRKTRVAAVGSPYAGGRPTRHSAMPS